MPALINGYLSAEPDAMDELHQDGIVAGFFIYPAIEAVEGEERTKQMQQLRDDLQEKIRKQAGDDVVAFLGGATGLYCGYLDLWPGIKETIRGCCRCLFTHQSAVGILPFFPP